MVLATQCPFCQTTFRVAQDQLKLRGGLVRCGSCKEVFDGNQHLVSSDIGRQLTALPATSPAEQRPAPTGWPPLPDQALRPVTPQARPVEREAVAAAAPPTPVTDISATFASIAAATSDAPWGIQTTSPAETRQEPATAEDLSPPQTLSPPEAETSVNTLTQALSYPIPRTSSVSPMEAPEEDVGDAAVNGAFSPMTMTGQGEVSEDNTDTEVDADVEENEGMIDGPDPEEAEEAPAFVQNAERRERRRRIGRIVMGIGACVLSVTLALQAMYVWRNLLAAWLPPTQPLLAKACAVLHCTVGLPTNIEQLVLESSELQLVPPNQNIYSLSVLLRNRSYGAQAWPYLELTLNDADEKAVMRRIFTPRDYLGTTQRIASGLPGEGEQQIKLTFELAQPAASGYRIYLFYP